MSHTLTNRESEIVDLVCEGLCNKDIARKLGLSAGTVKVHLHHVFQKLRVARRTELIVMFTTKKAA